MSKFRLLATGCVGVIVAFGTAVYAQNLSEQDRKFVENAAKGGVMEVHMGKMATEHAKSPAVKRFGQRMIDDHSKLNDQLMALAKKKAVSLPPADPGLFSKALGETSGAAFDKGYSEDMIMDHETDIKEFEKEATTGTDPEIKKFAHDALPLLQSHLQAAKAMNAQNEIQTPAR